MRALRGLSVVVAFAATLVVGAAAGSAQLLVVRAGVVHTGTGQSITDAVVVVRGGKIEAVGSAAEVRIPAGAREIEVAVATPGLIDAHSVVGLAGHLNTPHDQDQVEVSEPIQPELRALDAYNARERLVDWVRSLGVTTVHTGHAPAALVAGQTMIVKTRGDTVDEAMIVPAAMVAATLGEAAVVGEGKSPGTRSKAVAMLRAELVAARAYLDKRAGAEDGEGPERNLRHEALGRVLEGELPLLVTAHRHQDIASALRLQREFGFRLILDGAAEAYLLIEEIKAAGVAVLVHPTMMRASGEGENATMENAARLAEAGIPIALQSGYESYVPKTRVVLFEAAIAAAYGLGFDGALEAITSGAAKILGIDDRVGSIEVGKDGDLALFDGDPFEYASHCVGVVIEGELFDGESYGPAQ